MVDMSSAAGSQFPAVKKGAARQPQEAARGGRLGCGRRGASQPATARPVPAASPSLGAQRQPLVVPPRTSSRACAIAGEAPAASSVLAMMSMLRGGGWRGFAAANPLGSTQGVRFEQGLGAIRGVASRAARCRTWLGKLKGLAQRRCLPRGAGDAGKRPSAGRRQRPRAARPGRRSPEWGRTSHSW